jgi:hypothetical protein
MAPSEVPGVPPTTMVTGKGWVFEVGVKICGPDKEGCDVLGAG